MKIIVSWLLTAVAIMITGYILPGVVVQDFWVAVVTAVVLATVNVFIRPVLVILTIPVTIVTLGLFIFVINAFLVLLVSRVVEGFHVAGFWWALLFSVVLAVIKSVIESVLYEDEK